MLRDRPLANEDILLEVSQRSYLFNKIGRKQTARTTRQATRPPFSNGAPVYELKRLLAEAIPKIAEVIVKSQA